MFHFTTSKIIGPRWQCFTAHPLKQDGLLLLTFTERDNPPNEADLSRVSEALKRLPQLVKDGAMKTHFKEMVTMDLLSSVDFISRTDADLELCFSNDEDDEWVCIEYLNWVFQSDMAGD